MPHELVDSDKWVAPALHPATGLGRVGDIAQLWQEHPTPRRGWRRFEAHALVLVRHGSGSYADDTGLRCPLDPGDLVLIDPGRAHRYGPRRAWTTCFVVIDGPLISAWAAGDLLEPLRPVARLAQPERCYRTLCRLALERQSAEPDPLAGARELVQLQQLLLDLLGDQQPRRPASGWCSQAEARLTDPSRMHQTIGGIAAELGVAEATLRRRLASQGLESPHRLRTRARIERARQLLVAGRLSNRAIAAELGFPDQATFSKTFKRLLGVAPSVYRRQLP